MYCFEVTEIGRESVKSVNASMLATLIKELVSRYERNIHNLKQQNRKFYIKCKDKLEFSPKKYKKNGDDEGFESDGNEEDSLSGDLSNEDAQSTTSSCCMVEDHVFKSVKSELIHRNLCNKDPTSLVSIIGSIDSANSSGSSDTDEIEVQSLTPSPVTQTKKSLQKKFDVIFKSATEFENPDKKSTKFKREEYPISDVIFCHTEAKYPNVIAWVIKKNPSDVGSKSGVKTVENFSKIDNCLEVIVVKCKNGDNLKELCSNYLEYSKRTKLDNYKSIKRKADAERKKLVTLTPLTDSKDVKVSLSDMKIANSGLIKASELSILNPKIMTSFKNDIKNSVSLNSLIKTDKNSNVNKTTIEIKPSPVNGTPVQSSVTKTQSMVNISKTWEYESNSIIKTGILKEKNYNATGDQFNLIQRTDPNGVTHLEVTKTVENKKTIVPERFANKSKLRKEIEGVIITDIESYCKKEQIRQRISEVGDDFKKEKIYECPPIRPERKKFGRKKNPAPSPPVTTTHHNNLDHKIITNTTNRVDTNGKNSFYLSPTQNVVVVGDNRMKKEPNLGRSPLIDVKTWQNQNSKRNGNSKTGTRGRQQTKLDEKYVDKRRSTSAGRPSKKGPMPYRYIYISNDYRESPSIKRGLPSKIREVGGNLQNSLQNFRRRNSFDDLIAYNNNCNKTNLKSVIKKNKKINDKYCEPKKVTFSAFATVQVVD